MSNGLDNSILDNLLNEEEHQEKENSEEPKKFKDFENIEKKALSKAKRQLKALTKMYLSEEMYQDSYLNLKIRLDVDKLGDIIYLLETSKWSITSLLTEIDEGSKVARNYEALSSLQTKNLEINKTLKGLVQILEDEYKTYASNYVPKEESKKIEQGSSEYPFKGRGHSALIEMTRTLKEDEVKISDI